MTRKTLAQPLTETMTAECPKCGKVLKLTIYCHHRVQIYERDCLCCKRLWNITRNTTNRGQHRLSWKPA